ncbi:TetR family transcriptional regulator [Micromonospora mirobrigensis]|uniref:Transcriptional regulator, TetR family n=2 Tax=Micromonospora mirobrigensis TaxID=262898 RepID=A0A1C5AHL7_9ACTN|nr:TetR family transcriptional regulator [Micromonospora mirobrigensis]SCF44728.1 transcriptional regulator, TetR family [Micromonospora mirobrigensis]
MNRRAYSPEAKLRRTEDLLQAASDLALALGGVRHVTLAAVTEAAGLHPSAVRRYFDSKEDLLLGLAERGYSQWREAVLGETAGAHGLAPAQTAAIVARTLAAQPLFCDLLTHVPLSLEGEAGIDRAREYKTNAFAAFDVIVEALTTSGTMTAAQVNDLIVAASALASYFWQLANPTETLRELYVENPRWCGLAVDFEPRLTRLLQAVAVGLVDAGKEPAIA